MPAIPSFAISLAGLASILVLLGLSCPARSQQADPSSTVEANQYKISVNVGLVVLPVTVTDRMGEFVPGLHAENFRVYEAGRPEEISLFELEDVPVTVGLVVDNSGSMAAKQPAVIAASLAFAQSSNPRDQMFVVNFNRAVTLGLPKAVPFTSDLQQLKAALSTRPAAGKTALYDGVAVALEHLKAGTAERKALVVVTDGGDNASQLKFRDLLKMAESSSTIVYAIGIVDENYSDVNPEVLKRLAKVTGGRAYFPESVAAVVDVCKEIARDIRQQYTIGYVPATLAQGGKYRTIQVMATAPGEGKLHVRTRTGILIASESQPGSPIAQRGSP